MTRPERAAGQPFVYGRSYTRRDIHNEVGGNLQQYMPSVAGRVVAVCINPAPQLQPFPPRQIFVGAGSITRARAKRLSLQDEPVPVFIKQAPKEWIFEGYWRPARYVDEPRAVALEAEAAGVTRPVAAVLWLERYER